MISGFPTNGVGWFEDFFNVDFASTGNPSWLQQDIAGTGTVRCGSGATIPGALFVVSGATSGNCTMVSSSATTGAAATFLSGLDANLLVRCATTTTTTVRQGFGFVRNATVAVGTNWLNAPATVLTGTPYFVVVRDTGVTPSGGAAGDWCLYASDGAGADVNLPLGAASTSAVKFEFKYTASAGSGTLVVYKNDVLIGSVTITDNSLFSSFRFDFGVQTLTAATRPITIDCLYYETALAAAR